jgi:hypothetical protein
MCDKMTLLPLLLPQARTFLLNIRMEMIHENKEKTLMHEESSKDQCLFTDRASMKNWKCVLNYYIDILYNISSHTIQQLHISLAISSIFIKSNLDFGVLVSWDFQFLVHISSREFIIFIYVVYFSFSIA